MIALTIGLRTVPDRTAGDAACAGLHGSGGASAGTVGPRTVPSSAICCPTLGNRSELRGNVCVEHLDDVLALYTRRGARLPLEPLDGLRVLRRMPIRELQRQLFARPNVLDDVDDPMPPRPSSPSTR
jgi:hypothetical protein